MISHTFDPYLTPHSPFFIAKSSCVPWKNMEEHGSTVEGHYRLKKIQ